MTIWPFYQIIINRTVQWYSPEFYKELRSDYEWKYLFFFGMLIDLTMKPFSLVTCGSTTAFGPPTLIRRPGISTAQQFRWGARNFIYVEELLLFIHLPEPMVLPTTHYMYVTLALLGMLVS